MAEQPGSGRLDPEILAAYVDGRLPPEDRARVEAEIAADPETQEWLVNTIRAVDDVGAAPEVVEELELVLASHHRSVGRVPSQVKEESPALVRPYPPSRRHRLLLGGAGVVLATAAVLLLAVRVQPAWWQQLWGPAVDPRFAKLVTAVGEERYVEGRLSGGFKYGPLRSVTRGPGDLSNQNLALLAAAGELQKAAQEDPSAENLHAWGVAQILLGEDEGGVGTLEGAALDHPAVANIQADLAVAYLARFSQLGGGEDLARALNSAETAVRLDPQLAEAVFTRAVVLEEMRLLAAAARAWEAYLLLDPTSPWAIEAHRRLKEIRTEVSGLSEWDLRSRVERVLVGQNEEEPFGSVAKDLAAADPRTCFEIVVTTLLPRLARAVLNGGDTSTAERLLQAVAHGAGRADDMLIPDLVEVAISTAGGDTIRQHAADTFILLSGAYAAGRESRFDVAADYLTLLGAEGDHVLQNPTLRLLVATSHVRLDRSWRLAESIESEVRDRRYRWLLAELLFTRGVSAFTSADYVSAERAYAEAAQLFDDSGDRAGLTLTRLNQAILLRYLGDSTEGWQQRIAALQTLPRDADPMLRHNVLVSLAISAFESGLGSAALRLLAEASVNAEAWGRAGAQAEILQQRAMVRHTLGDSRGALVDIADAGHSLERETDAVIRRRIGTTLRIRESEVLLSVDPRSALTSVGLAFEGLTSVGDRVRRARLLMLNARAHRKLGQQDRARQALLRGMAAIEEERQGMAPGRRISYFDAVWDLFGEAADLELSRSAPSISNAFDYLEAGRGRTLQERVGSSRLSLEQVQSAMAPDEAMLLFALADDRLWTIAITAHSVAVGHQALSRVNAERLVNEHLSEIRGVAAGFKATSYLFDILIRPSIATIQGVTLLAVIPDEPFSAVSFAALHDSTNNSFLIERTRIAVAPSASLYASLSRTVRTRRTAAPGTAFLLANSPDDGTLPELPGALAEVSQIAALYPQSVVSVQRAATLGRLIREAPRAHVIHLAAHAVANPEYPDLSAMFLRHNGRTVRVGMRAFESLNTHQTVVAVLAACQSARGAVRRGEGAMSVARGLLMTGIPSVIASIDDLPDLAATGFFVTLHTHLAEGLDPAGALRQAQLADLSAQRRRTANLLASTWSRVALFGGS